MAKITLLIFGIVVASCSAQFGFNRNERFQERQQFPLPQRQTPLPFLHPFVANQRQQQQPLRLEPRWDQMQSVEPFGGLSPPSATEKKCFTLARRPFFMTRIVQYPCDRRTPGMQVVRSFMGPMGPICMSYIREPVFRYFKIPVCCPGYIDQREKCFPINNMGPMVPRIPQQQPERQQEPQMPPVHNHERMMNMASMMRQAMVHRAQKDMARRRAMLLIDMRNRNQQQQQQYFMPQQQRDQPEPEMRMMPHMPQGPPPMSRMFHMYNIHRNMMEQRRQEQQQQQQPQPRIAFLRFPSHSTPPMPHPVKQPPLNGGRFISLIRRPFNPQSPFPFVTRPSLPAPPMYNLMNMNMNTPPMIMNASPMRRIIPRIVLSTRTTIIPLAKLREFNTNIQNAPTQEAAPVMKYTQTPDQSASQEQTPYEALSKKDDKFPTIPEPKPQDSMFQADGFQGVYPHFGGGPDSEAFQETSTDGFQDVELPQMPVEMPDLIMEQAPPNTLNQESCIVQLESAVKTCLKDNGIDVPDVMSAFEPFNEDKSRLLCASEDAIFKCISDALQKCGQKNDVSLARDMLLETAQTVKSMCDLREANVPEVRPDTASPAASTADTSVENVDALPTDVKLAAIAEKPQVKSATPEKIMAVKSTAHTEDAPAPEAAAIDHHVQEAIQHEVHVQEVRIKEYLVPILLGAGVGFIALVLVVSLIVCCCCKRRLNKKMKIAKECEKPPLQDAIFTIGIAPPTYETHGIPPMYYEEAKGVKITAGSPAVVAGTDAELVEAGNNTQI
ncbi:uncharacterized protein LOC127850447 isoform X2 [Dreissena polymorpha]|uniref:uncharacterized protein LOC127850447 isoform X2 n=1 Tax=Dreissena polymorpha TaxID=45954 RepID=UPI002265634A|nr:uncharacterized protein LOC127850447 isoform X2 [Dreissena polymorpha]